MEIKCTVIGDTIEDKKTQTPGTTRKVRRLLLLDADQAHNVGQVFQLDLPPEHSAVGVGKTVIVLVKAFPVDYTGRIKITGEVTTGK